MAVGSRKRSTMDVAAGAKVRARRNELGMSQTKLADAIGVTFQQVQKYENGANRMGSSRLAQIAACLGVTPQYFFPDFSGGKMATAIQADDIVTFALSKEMMPLMRAYTRIKSRQKKLAIVAFVARIADPG